MERDTFLTHLALFWEFSDFLTRASPEARVVFSLSSLASAGAAAVIISLCSSPSTLTTSFSSATTGAVLISASLDALFLTDRLELVERLDLLEPTDLFDTVEPFDLAIGMAGGSSPSFASLTDLTDPPLADSLDFLDLMDLADALELVERLDRVERFERMEASLLGADFNSGKTDTSAFSPSSTDPPATILLKGESMAMATCSFSSPTSTENSLTTDAWVLAGDGAMTGATAPAAPSDFFSPALFPSVAAVTVVLSGDSRTVESLVLMAITSSESAFFVSSSFDSSSFCFSFFFASLFALVVLETISVALESTLRMVRKLSLLLDLERDFFCDFLLSSVSDSDSDASPPPFFLRPRDLDRDERHRANMLLRPMRLLELVLFVELSTERELFFFFFRRIPPQAASSASDSISEGSTTSARSPSSLTCSGSSAGLACSSDGSGFGSGFGTKSAGRTVSTSS
mmetsp:Transcript_9586/g.20824  ORF Transcript_9586/g.20824 Transcript_9586/m.20824 type:complete len:459 (+) Transcript_9586:683-2059(+)